MEHTILLVSDSPTQRMALQSLLSGYGYNIITAGDGVSALNRVYREMPSLIVSDVVLPNLGGYHLCRLLKNDPHTAHVHVILLTSLDQKRNRFWGLEAGADIYLEKQGSPEPILEAVGQLLRDAQPASNGNQALAMHAASFSDFSATTHLNTLLDQLLFELTVRNAVRDVAQDTREREELYAGLFGLLERVFDYDVASLVVQNPEGMQIIFDTPTALNAHDLYALVDTIQDEQTPGTAGQQSLYVDLIRPDMVFDAASAQFINSHISVAFEIDQDIRAQLGLYSTQENAYGQESNSILKVVSDELATVLHGIAKTDEIEQLKADFTAMLVHDLRSPLTAVIGYAELILMDDGDPLSEQQQHHIARVARRGRDLLALVNDILELSKLEAGLAVLQPDWVELNTLVTRVSEDMSMLADERGVTLKLALDAQMPPLRADEHKLERVLVNLLSNAIKFTLKDGSVVLRAWHQSEPGPVDMSNYVFISIADTGQGIPQHKLKRLFKKYGQADDKHGQTGTGLGLAICKEIVEAHQGRIWVQSQEGEGTTITLTLPVNGPAKVVGVELNNAE